MRISGDTDPGCKHEQNQDSYKAGRLPNGTAWIALCDGMGGVESGGKASEFAVDFIESAVEGILIDARSEGDVREFMADTINRCNAEIFAMSRDEQDRMIMGTTIVFAVVKDAKAHIMHAGDSRAYLVNAKEMRQITRDHSMVQELVDAGKITEQQARNHPNRNIITSALGVEPELKSDYNELKLKKGEMLLFCSDGLSNMLSDEEMAAIIRENDFFKAPERLVKKAVELGGFDNITAVLFDEADIGAA